MIQHSTMSTAWWKLGGRNRRSGRRAALGAAIVAMGVLAAACSSGSSTTTTTSTISSTTHTTTASSANATVRTAQATGVGTVLVDSAGRTLYLFTPDKQSSPTCTGTCATIWAPLVVTGQPTAGSGVTASLLGTVRDANGATQVTYNHWPLYTFAGDTAAGQAKGQGLNTFGGHWSALDRQGASAQTTSGSTPTTRSSSGGNGY
jgi:predicted lipoprotein with Yx(FWY)xxD motif